MISDLNYAIAMATVRIIAGVLFFFQGYDKVFRIGVDRLRETIRVTLQGKSIPDSALSAIAIFTSWVELICGFLLIIGFFKYYAIYLLCLSLLIVVTGFSLVKPMWENNHMFIRLILLLILLVAPVEWDRFSLDYLYLLSKLN